MGFVYVQIRTKIGLGCVAHLMHNLPTEFNVSAVHLWVPRSMTGKCL